jgi:nucleotide-binding universal stress UspA family protein
VFGTSGPDGASAGAATLGGVTNRIVVGVDGSVGARTALLWAVDECRLRRRTLLIVHAPDGAAVATAGAPSPRALDEFGERLLGAHAAAASARQPGVAVTTMLSHEPAADTLVVLSGDADLLVVGTHGLGGNLASILGSVSHRVAPHAHCPVAVVPDQPVLNGGGAPASRLVVGVSATVSGRAALEFALEEAVRRDATVVAVRAGHESAAVNRAAVLPRDLAPLLERYPGARVEPDLVTAEPAEALLAAARDAVLLVVGCHHSDDRWSTRLGPVPSAILHRVPCPVVVVGRRRDVPVAAA